MIISPTQATAGTTTGSTKASDPNTDPAAAQDRFLKLLVAQLNNQDPMNPLDNAQMTSQMAQINTVTGIQQLNQTMASMAAQFNSLQVMQGTALVGRSVLTEGSTVTIDDKTGKGGFELASAATSVKVEIVNANGQVVDTVDMGGQGAGRRLFNWDSSKYAGSTDGLRFRVTALNGSTQVGTTSLALSKVVAAGAEDGQLMLNLSNGQAIRYTDIKAMV